MSSLLEHWLDWDSKKATSPSSCRSAHSACDCSSRCPHHDHATAADDSDSDDSGIGFGNFGEDSEEVQAEWIRQICANGCDYVNRADSDGKTILHYLLEGESGKDIVSNCGWSIIEPRLPFLPVVFRRYRRALTLSMLPLFSCRTTQNL